MISSVKVCQHPASASTAHAASFVLDATPAHLNKTSHDMEKGTNPNLDTLTSRSVERDAALDWNGPNDPENPQTWSQPKKLYHILVPTALGLVVSLGTSIYPPSAAKIATQFDTSSEVSLLGFTLFVIGLAFGPVIGSPTSEMFGRRFVYLVTIPIFALFSLAVGFARNIETIIICRFLAGFFGGPTLAIGAGTNADLYPPQQRAATTSLVILSVFLATGIAPAISSYVNSRKDWRWVEWTLVFITIPAYLFCIFTKETNKTIILRRRAEFLGVPPPSRASEMGILKFMVVVVIYRPIHMLFTEPIVGAFAIYVAFNFAVIFGFLPSIPLIFGTVYGFTPEQTGLPFLGIAVGCLLSVPTIIILDNRLYQKRLRQAVDEEGKTGIPPEFRLYGALLGSISLPVSLFWFAWTTTSSVHWIVPTLALIPFSWGTLCIFISCVLYMVDTYLAANGASAMAANGLLRYIAGACFPLVTIQMYNGVGFAWASSLLAFVTVALLPVPWGLFWFGHIVRRRSGYETWKG